MTELVIVTDGVHRDRHVNVVRAVLAVGSAVSLAEQVTIVVPTNVLRVASTKPVSGRRPRLPR